jgi:hypothetical protein
MQQAVNSDVTDLEQIAARLHDLECRVADLERRLRTSVPDQSQQITSFPSAPSNPTLQAAGQGLPRIEMPTAAVPVLGKAVLGIAGAYLLRALAEAGPIPKLPILVLAITYATLWMIWAVRTHDTDQFASATYATTSVLILAPLLWECTVRFQVIPPAFTAIVLVAFIVLALTLSWRRQLQVIPWVAALTVVITALALIIATRDLVPLTAAMLAVAAITETAACLEHHLSLRFVPALAADFAIWLLIDVMTSAEGVPEDYHPTSAVVVSILCFALVAAYGGSIGIRNFWLRRRISAFEIFQGVLAFALAAFGSIRATHGSESWLLGLLFLLLAAIFYWSALSYFENEANSRNRRVCAAWASALLLVGTFLVFSAKLRAPFLCLAALAATLLYSYTQKFSLGLHASFYLAAATAVSSLPTFGMNAMAGAVPSAPSWNVSIIGIAALLCYLVGSRIQEAHIRRRCLWVVPAVLFGFTSAAVVVVTIFRFASDQMELTPPRLSVVRTIVNCVLATVLGFAGSRWKHIELGWVAYASVAFGTLKILLEDLRFGNAASLVVSLLCYGSILILMPRLTRRATAKR